MVKIIPYQIPTTKQKNSSAAKFPIPQLGGFPLPLTFFGNPCQMWCNHPFNQRNKAAKRAVGVEVGEEEGEWTRFEKGEGG